MLPLIGAKEFLQGGGRYCLWLEDVEPTAIRRVPPVYDRVATNRALRLESSRPQLANVAAEFAQITQRPERAFLLVPAHSSESREYIPMGFFDAGNVAHNSCLVIPQATTYQFGILSSRMHMAWTKVVCGRLKSDYRCSKDIVYNNFVFPNATAAQKAEIGALGDEVLAARAAHPTSTLATLYDPTLMPKDLRKAHTALDAAADRLYRKKAYADDVQRVGHLFDLLAGK